MSRLLKLGEKAKGMSKREYEDEAFNIIKSESPRIMFGGIGLEGKIKSYIAPIYDDYFSS